LPGLNICVAFVFDKHCLHNVIQNVWGCFTVEGGEVYCHYVHSHVRKGRLYKHVLKCYSNFIAEKKYFNSGHEEHSPELQQYKRRDIFTNIKCVNAFWFIVEHFCAPFIRIFLLYSKQFTFPSINITSVGTHFVNSLLLGSENAVSL
jgi:hypothetical protein